MSHRFVRCPHCRMPHDAAERVCPNTGLRLNNEVRPISREGAGIVGAAGSAGPVLNVPSAPNSKGSSRMSEIPPPTRQPQPLAFDPQRDRVPPSEHAAPGPPPASVRSGEVNTLPPTRDLQRELVGQTVGGRYKIKGVLGEGGMGTVYDAEHLGLSRQVAIKVLSSSQAKKRVAVKRFQQEARAAGAIGHPNICEVYDLGLLDDGSPYLVMEKLIGQTLAERISKEGGMPFDDVVDVVVQVLSGLIAAHEKGIIHRDIKPENIFLARRLGCPPIIKLLDFGVSKMMAEFQQTGDDALDLTRTGMVMGTPYYMSPEQARGERNLDGRVDVYACGVVMYEAIAGKRPFLAPNYNALLLAIINTNPRPLREMRPKTPPELEAIIQTAMARNRNDRYPTAKDFLRQLAPPQSSIADGSGRLPAPPTMEERRRAPVLGGGRSPDSVRAPPQQPPPSAALVNNEVSTRHDARGPRAGAPVSLRAREQQLQQLANAATQLPPGDDIPPPSRGYHEPLDRPDGPSATLRSRMQSGANQRDRDTSTQRDTTNPSPQQRVVRSTRLDVKMPRQQPPQQPHHLLQQPLPDNDESFDIPIHVAPEEEDDDELRQAELNRMMPDEEPTEIFRPGKAYPMPKPTQKPAAKAAPAPVVAADDWEGETVVKRPDMVPPSSPPSPPPQQQPQKRAVRRERPFNPDETMKLDNSGEHIDPRLLPRRR